MHFRKESDFLGDLLIDNKMYYGINTARSMKNFAIGDSAENMPVFLYIFSVPFYTNFHDIFYMYDIINIKTHFFLCI